jgi:integrase/recombinase XerC
MDDKWIVGFVSYIEIEKRLSPHSVSSYQRDLHHFFLFCQKNELNQWQAINSHHIRSYVASRHKTGLSGRSLQRELSTIRNFYKYLMREERVKINPVIGVSAPKTPRKLPKVFDVDQMNQLLGSPAKNPLKIRDWAMMEILYSSGLRLAELLSLDIDSIDFDNAMVRVTGKGSKTRVLPVGRYAIESIQRWLGERFKIANVDEKALFVSKQGKRLSPRSIQQRLANWGLENGIEGRVHPHRLRHSFASHMLESSSDLRAVQELLGHEDISTTQIYTHLDFQHLAKVYDTAHPRARKKNSTKS